MLVHNLVTRCSSHRPRSLRTDAPHVVVPIRERCATNSSMPGCPVSKLVFLVFPGVPAIYINDGDCVVSRKSSWLAIALEELKGQWQCATSACPAHSKCLRLLRVTSLCLNAR